MKIGIIDPVSYTHLAVYKRQTTGYYLKKYMHETVSLAPSNEKKKPHHFIIFRYAEILLNYAEAMDAWKDADYTDNDHPVSYTHLDVYKRQGESIC